MTTLALTVERIQVKSREFDLARALLTLIALPFFVLGWSAFYAYRVVQLVCGWVWAALIVGWHEAAGRKDGAG